MKKNSFKILVRKFAGAIFIAAGLTFTAVAAETHAHPAFHETEAVVKYLGIDNERYVFNVAYSNESGEKFLLRITDAEGNTLFAATYNDRKFDKRFKLLKEESDGKLKFVIKNLKDSSVQTFEVTTTTQVVEDVVIRRVL